MAPRKTQMSINEVDSIPEAILYFFKYILLEHYIKIIVFVLIVTFSIIGFKCSTKWFTIEKEALKVPGKAEVKTTVVPDAMKQQTGTTSVTK